MFPSTLTRIQGPLIPIGINKVKKGKGRHVLDNILAGDTKGF